MTAGEKRWVRFTEALGELDRFGDRTELHDEAVRHLRKLAGSYSQQAKVEKAEQLRKESSAWCSCCRRAEASGTRSY